MQSLRFDISIAVFALGVRRALAPLVQALPQACALCAAPSADTVVCAACSAALPHAPEACPACAMPSPGGAICGACLAAQPAFDAAIAPFLYAFPVDRLLHAFKYASRFALADFFAASLAAAAMETGRGAELPERIVPLPLAPGRQRERGFNQAREIAVRVARLTGIEAVDALVRAEGGAPQAGLSRRARVRNVRGAFAADARVAGRSIAIVDDVLTTGATLEAAARAARAAGAVRVEAWVVARTPKRP